MATDVSKLTTKQLHDKIIFDLFTDISNYDHSVPLIMLLVEYSINNIPFKLLHFISILLIQYTYILFQWFYSIKIEHKPVYDFMNWFTDPMGSMLRGMFTLVVSSIFAIIVINLNNCKIMMATGINVSKEL